MRPSITVDVGTTSVKLSLFDAGGRPQRSTKHATPTQHDAFGEVYDLEALFGIVTDFVADLAVAERAAVERIAITGVGESGGLVRPDLSLASPMILWHDHRGAAALDALTAAERLRIYEVTGLPANANYGLSKIAWAIAHADDLGGAQWLNIAEYLAAHFTGVRWSEYSLASRTMALDLSTGTWSREICALLGVDVSVLPELRPAADGAPLTAEAAARMRLSESVRVHVAGHDHMVGAVGADLQPGELLNSTGTTEGLLFLRDAPSTDEAAARTKLANGISCTGSGYTLFASIPSGGAAFATLQRMLGMDVARLSACIASLGERYVSGAIDLEAMPLVLPQFRGSPPPEKRSSARGAIAGIRTDTTAEDIVFGCFLGMALQFRDVLDLFGETAARIKVIGPASGNPLWLQLKADLLGVPLSVAGVSEVVSRGAQALASDARPDWAESAPRDVTVSEAGRARLHEWAAAVRPQWDHLKALP